MPQESPFRADHGVLAQLLLPFAGVVVLVSGMVVRNDQPLSSGRPEAEVPASKKESEDSGPEGREIPGPKWALSVPAKMFEDPFDAVERTSERERQAARINRNGPVSDDFRGKFRKVLFGPKDDNGEVMIAVVLLPGGRFLSSKEERLRTHYAVLSGLLAAGFKMDFLERMTVISASTRVEVGGGGEEESLLSIPTKLFSRLPGGTHLAGSSMDRVLVLWLNELQLGERPLTAIARVLDSYLPGCLEVPWRKRLHLAILGPSGSDMLQAMLLDDQKYKRPDPPAGEVRSTAQGVKTQQGPASGPPAGDSEGSKSPKQGLAEDCSPRGLEIFSEFKSAKLYSPRATVSFEGLGREGYDLMTREKVGVLNCQLRVIPTIGTDRQLAQALSRELELRDAWPVEFYQSKNSPRHVVLVFEQDSIYGRAFVQSLVEFIPEENLHTFGYRGGLDGKTPYQPKKSSAPKGIPQAVSSEIPLGEAQFDYLRRIADEVSARDEELRRTDRGRITAVGVVGTDIFDKLLIFQALRGRFPRSRFFTTDLDAHYSDQGASPFTRNLIVASHYGLSLHRDLRLDTAPFRDSYQTSTFFSTLLALDADTFKNYLEPFKVDPWGRFSNRQEVLQPLVQEIGRSSPYRLQFQIESPVSKRLQAEPAAPISSREILPFAALILLMVILLLLYFKPIETFCLDAAGLLGRIVPEPFRTRIGISAFLARHPPTKERRIILGVCLIFAASFLAVVLYDGSRQNGEPLALFQGVSIWPSVLLRGLIGLVAGWFLWLAIDRFFATEAHVLRHGNGSRTTGPELFRKIALRVFLYYSIATLLFNMTGAYPGTPSRGAVSWWSCTLVTHLATVALQAVTFLVIEAITFMRRTLEEWTESWRARLEGLLSRAEDSTKEPIDAKTARDALDLVQCAATETERIGTLFYLPFVLVLAMFGTRLSFFDGWDFEWPLAIIGGLLLVGTFLEVLRLRQKAAALKSVLVSVVSTLSRDALENSAGSRDLREALDYYVTRIQEERRGALRPLLEDPILRAAIALPTGGTGALLLLESLFGKL
jgi:hypothetical protein